MEQLNNIQKSHFLNLFHIALSDNEIDPLELKELYRIGDENGVPKDEINFIIENPHKVQASEINSDLQLFHNFLDISRMILADNKIDPREILLFKRLAKRYNIKTDIAEALIEHLIDLIKDNPQATYSANSVALLFKSYMKKNKLDKILN
tara:strand:- start:27 stop:476 length:450 start_codon:yes stop_codon:yes gene_type:complete